MRTQVVEGSPREVAERIQHIADRRIVAVLLMDELSGTGVSSLADVSEEEFGKLMAELQADAVAVGHVDDSREAIYTRMDGE